MYSLAAHWFKHHEKEQQLKTLTNQNGGGRKRGLCLFHFWCSGCIFTLQSMHSYVVRLFRAHSTLQLRKLVSCSVYVKILCSFWHLAYCHKSCHNNVEKYFHLLHWKANSEMFLNILSCLFSPLSWQKCLLSYCYGLMVFCWYSTS